jgi:hypothetical protein
MSKLSPKTPMPFTHLISTIFFYNINGFTQATLNNQGFIVGSSG